MHFPVDLRIGSLSINPHPVLEAIAYVVAFRAYLSLRRKSGDPIAEDFRWWIVAAAAAGAAIGSRVLFWFEDPGLTIAHWRDPAYLLSGKTIVGGLIGGWLAVEFAKQRLGTTHRTGDLFALPLCVGIAIGRIGCFLAGLPDDTAGSRTNLPWGINFGDGPRHPTQLYEILFLAILGFAIVRASHLAHREGGLFRIFMAGYFAFRLASDFLKPEARVIFGLSSIQLACLATLIYLGIERRRVVASAPATIQEVSVAQ